MASRPLRKRLPLPVASSFNESLRAARSSAMERFAFARAAHALSAAAALRLPGTRLECLNFSVTQLNCHVVHRRLRNGEHYKGHCNRREMNRNPRSPRWRYVSAGRLLGRQKRTQTSDGELRRTISSYPLRRKVEGPFKQLSVAGNLAGNSLGRLRKVLNPLRKSLELESSPGNRPPTNGFSPDQIPKKRESPSVAPCRSVQIQCSDSLRATLLRTRGRKPRDTSRPRNQWVTNSAKV